MDTTWCVCPPSWRLALNPSQGGINGSGQIPDLAIPLLIDKDTPTNVYTRTGHDGRKYALIFSDEFEQEQRTFYPGDDPYWEAVDFHYWCVFASTSLPFGLTAFLRPTGDLEWYDPQVRPYDRVL